MKKIAIFASGSGSNAQNIVEYFAQKPVAKVELILTNRNDAYVLKRAENFNIPAYIFSREEFYSSDIIYNILEKHHIDLIVLAGFLWLIPQNILEAYPNRIINVHPALLPKYGGKGMYGAKVHEAVLANHDKKSGISIHYINERYDEGDIIFQTQCEVLPSDTPDSLAQRVHALEYEHFPRIIDKIISAMPQ